MMGQRKLTDEELQDLMHARHYLRLVARLIGIPTHLGVVLSELDARALHATSDGEPYIEPQPEVGEGYRVATWSDKDRRDLEFWSKAGGGWQHRKTIYGTPLDPDYDYRVPIDRIPTDEDARQRPTVMVRHHGEKLWRTMPLVAVVKSDRPFITLQGTVIWRFQEARFPYPGELD